MDLLRMKRFKRVGSKQKIGLPPGTLVHIGERKTEKIKITIIDYDQKDFQEKEVDNIEDCFPFKDSPTVTWINIDGLQEVGVIEKIGHRAYRTASKGRRFRGLRVSRFKNALS